MKKLKNLLDFNDLCLIVGVGLVAVGIWQIYHPAGYIAVGLGLGWWGLSGRSKQ